MDTYIIYGIFIAITIGHYCFSCQRHLYKISQEFRIAQSDLDILMSGWVLFMQVFSTVAKFTLLIYLGFSNSWGNAISWFIFSAFVHIFFPLIPVGFYRRMYFDKANYIKNYVDTLAGSQLERILKSSKYLNS